MTWDDPIDGDDFNAEMSLEGDDLDGFSEFVLDDLSDDVEDGDVVLEVVKFDDPDAVIYDEFDADDLDEDDDDVAKASTDTVAAMPTFTTTHLRRHPLLPDPDDENPDYKNINKKLGAERIELQNKITALQKKKKRSGAQDRELKRLQSAYDKLVTDMANFNFGLVLSYASHFTSRTSKDDTADIIASGMVGLMRAISTYDPEKGAFASWSYHPIQRACLKAVRDLDHSNMTNTDFEARPAIMRAYKDLQGDDPHYEPEDEEVALRAGVAIDQVGRALRPPTMTSLHAPIGDDDGAGELGDIIADAGQDVEGSVLRSLSISALERYGLTELSGRELFVIVRRFGLDGEKEMRLASIGDLLDLSREAVRQIENKALSRLLHPSNLRRMVRNGRD